MALFSRKLAAIVTFLTPPVFPIELRTGGFAARFRQMVANTFSPGLSDTLAAAARDKWQMALRTRKLASALSWDSDRETLTSYAEELEREAEALERLAAQQQ
jgi:hypothetical protein